MQRFPCQDTSSMHDLFESDTGEFCFQCAYQNLCADLAHSSALLRNFIYILRFLANAPTTAITNTSLQVLVDVCGDAARTVVQTGSFALLKEYLKIFLAQFIPVHPASMEMFVHSFRAAMQDLLSTIEGAKIGLQLLIELLSESGAAAGILVFHLTPVICSNFDVLLERRRTSVAIPSMLLYLALQIVQVTSELSAELFDELSLVFHKLGVLDLVCTLVQDCGSNEEEDVCRMNAVAFLSECAKFSTMNQSVGCSSQRIVESVAPLLLSPNHELVLLSAQLLLSITEFAKPSIEILTEALKVATAQSVVSLATLFCSSVGTTSIQYLSTVDAILSTATVNSDVCDQLVSHLKISQVIHDHLLNGSWCIEELQTLFLRVAPSTSTDVFLGVSAVLCSFLRVITSSATGDDLIALLASHYVRKVTSDAIEHCASLLLECHAQCLITFPSDCVPVQEFILSFLHAVERHRCLFTSNSVVAETYLDLCSNLPSARLLQHVFPGNTLWVFSLLEIGFHFSRMVCKVVALLFRAFNVEEQGVPMFVSLDALENCKVLLNAVPMLGGKVIVFLHENACFQDIPAFCCEQLQLTRVPAIVQLNLLSCLERERCWPRYIRDPLDVNCATHGDAKCRVSQRCLEYVCVECSSAVSGTIIELILSSSVSLEVDPNTVPAIAAKSRDFFGIVTHLFSRDLPPNTLCDFLLGCVAAESALAKPLLQCLAHLAFRDTKCFSHRGFLKLLYVLLTERNCFSLTSHDPTFFAFLCPLTIKPHHNDESLLALNLLCVLLERPCGSIFARRIKSEYPELHAIINRWRSPPVSEEVSCSHLQLSFSTSFVCCFDSAEAVKAMMYLCGLLTRRSSSSQLPELIAVLLVRISSYFSLPDGVAVRQLLVLTRNLYWGSSALQSNQDAAVDLLLLIAGGNWDVLMSSGISDVLSIFLKVVGETRITLRTIKLSLYLVRESKYWLSHFPSLRLLLQRVLDQGGDFANCQDLDLVSLLHDFSNESRTKGFDCHRCEDHLPPRGDSSQKIGFFHPFSNGEWHYFCF